MSSRPKEDPHGTVEIVETRREQGRSTRCWPHWNSSVQRSTRGRTRPEEENDYNKNKTDQFDYNYKFKKYDYKIEYIIF